MPGSILTTASTITCPHGGSANLTTANTRTTAGRAAALLETDIHTVTGCAFTIGSKPSPCLRIEWTAGAASVNVLGTPILVQSSIGTCYSPESAPQGVALMVNTQQKAMAR